MVTQTEGLRVVQAMDSLEFPEPGVGDDGAQDGREITEAAESVVDGCGQVVIPLQVGEEVERQHRWETNTQEGAVRRAPRPAGTRVRHTQLTVGGSNNQSGAKRKDVCICSVVAERLNGLTSGERQNGGLSLDTDVNRLVRAGQRC